MPPELPAFVKRTLRRAGRQIPQGEREVSENIGALYNEFWSCSGVPGWLESPRGRWVDYQLTWHEQRADRWTN